AGRRRPLFAADAGPGATAAFELRAGDRLGVYLIRDGSAADWLAANPANDPAGGPVAVFPFAAANPAGADLFRAGPRNRAAFEDTAGADDDRNDAIVGFRVTGERSDLPEPPPPPPPPPANTAPTVSDLPDATVAFGVALGPVAFTVGDAETPAGDLVVTATTSDPALFPADRLVLDGSGAARTLVVTPAAGASGTATVTVTVTDAGGLTATDTFTLTVEPATQNAPPTISAVADRVIPAGGSTGPIPFTVADAETPAADLIVESATSDPVTVVLGGAGADRTVRVSPIGTWTGTATIALVVRDTGGANATETFEVVVVGPTPFGDLAGWTARRAGRVRGPARHRGGRQRPGRPPRG
ncbi:MAG: hypothetical protein K2X82_27945, partial [Gemmataceae bacterium]|nr:hypothetical protein [Gemmataceae bacterium]